MLRLYMRAVGLFAAGRNGSTRAKTLVRPYAAIPHALAASQRSSCLQNKFVIRHSSFVKIPTRLPAVLSYLRPYKGAALLNILYNLLATFFAIVSFVVLKPFLDILFSTDYVQSTAPQAVADGWLSNLLAFFGEGLRGYMREHGKQSALAVVCLLILVMFFLKNLFRYGALFVMSPARNGIERDLRARMMEKMLHLPLSFFADERRGDLLSRFGMDVQEVQNSTLRSLEAFVRAPITIMGSLGVMLYISPMLTLFSFALMLVVGTLIGKVGKTLKRSSTRAQGLLGALLSAVEESVAGLRILRAYGAEAYRAEQFARTNEDLYTVQMQMQRRRELSSPLTEFLGIAIIAILLLFGGHLVFEGYFEASTFVVFVMMFYNIIEPAKSFSSAFYDIQRGQAAMERIEWLLRLPASEQAPSADSAPLPAERENWEINYENVGFTYPDAAAPALQELHLRLPFGKCVAIVGASGSGKSTLLDLLARLQNCTEGRITLGGVDITEVEASVWRKQLGIVSQEAILFNDTIAANIRLSSSDAEYTDEQLWEACRLAQCDFVKDLAEGLQTNIGERGSKLSGGQRQRLTLARALLRRPAFLLLDEATSALDSESEHLIQEALTALKGKQTIILIAHRLSTVQIADEVVVMQSGRIVEQGAPQELLQRGGLYSKFVELQR